MNNLITVENIQLLITIGATIFGIYLYFRNPQINSDKKESNIELKIANMQLDVTNLRDNHLHSLDVKLDETNKNVALLTVQIARLSTIIDERVPRKNI